MQDYSDNLSVIYQPSFSGDILADNSRDGNIMMMGQFIQSSDETVPISQIKDRSLSPIFWVIISSLLASIGGLLFGYDEGIISTAGIQLTSEFSLTCMQQELVVISIALGAFIATIFSGILVDYVGRKKSITINCFIFVTGSLFLGFSNNFALIIIGRIIVGFGVGLATVADGVYIAEISPEKWRGAFVALHELAITVGFLLAYTVGYFLIDVVSGWRIMFCIPIGFASVQFIGILFPPESPRFLVAKNKFAQAKESLSKLRNVDCIDEEIEAIKSNIQKEKHVNFCHLFLKKDNMRWRLALAVILAAMTQCSGQMNILYYAPSILSSFGFTSEHVILLASIGIGTVKVIFTGIAIVLIDKIGRRKLLICGTILMTTMLFMLSGVLFNLDLKLNSETCDDVMLINQSEDAISDQYYNIHKIVAIFGFFIYIAGYSLSFGPVMWVLFSELFPIHLKGRAVSIALAVMWLFQMINSGTFLNLFVKLGYWQTFLFYGLLCLAFNVFIILFIPETKGQSLEQVSDMFRESSSSFMGIKSTKAGNYVNLDET